MKRISIFCGSSSGINPIYDKTAFEVGKYLAENKYEIAYGGSSIGLMGAVANGALKNGGVVVGVIPDFLATKEIAHTGVSELIEVKSMHERKLLLSEMSDAAIALPGGFGTMDELFEILTWAQLGLHKNPVGVLNMNGFYDPLFAQAQIMVNKGFVKKLNQDMLLEAATIEELIPLMESYVAPEVKKWITKSTT